ncbi:hypothetical protein UA32_12000 [Photobacterium angustum]|uniref:DNA 3'-5' helicase n=1 Tax=Photobacterium angustum TaxID=661 RepID=A0ABX5GYR3_PHOAN|nr:ATP-dependent helicase [Photobacterium angustum]KJG37680.1 hypothetical protein UA32_12000 [Photobacterium angustum]PSX01651.1 ATP-dependent helicase [Photobacterium angustum]
MGLTTQQKRVVDSQQNCECVALPGSGKSHTVVQYIKEKINENPFNKLLAISFTRKAAQELRDRIGSELGKNSEAMKRIGISTFDAVFIKQIKQALGVKTLRLMNNGERRNLIFRAIKASGYSMKVDDVILDIDEFGGYISIPRSLVEAKKESFEIFTKYTELRKQKKMWDFPSVSVAVVSAQKNGTISLLPITHLVIDEFQDTNDIQFQWVEAYSANENIKVLTVGDDDQSVYSWRQSLGYVNFLRFKEVFKPETHVLDICFRCKPVILHCARSLIEFNSDRVPKTMKSIYEEGGTVQTWLVNEPKKGSKDYSLGQNESEVVLKRLKQCFLPSDPNFDENAPKFWAVLARTNRELWKLAAQLEALGIEYRTKPSESILCSQGADMVNKIMFTVVHEKKTWMADILSWFGCTEDEINASRSAGGLSARYSLANYVLNKEEPETQEEKVFYYINMVIKHQPNLEQGLKIINDLLYERTDYLKLKERDVSSLKMIIDIFKTTGDELSFMESARNFLKMVQKSNKKENETEEFCEGVDLMTLHSSKGLQWDGVWLIGFSDKVFPSEPEKGVNPKKALEILEEERRLAYVGMTRAKSELHISSNNKLSRFIHEMGDYLHTLNANVKYEVFNKVSLDGKESNYAPKVKNY